MCFPGAKNLENEKPRRKKRIVLSHCGFWGQRILSNFSGAEVHATTSLEECEVFLNVPKKRFQFSGSAALRKKKVRDRIQCPGESVSENAASMEYQTSNCASYLKLEDRITQLFFARYGYKRVQDRALTECACSTVPTLYQIIYLAPQFEELAARVCQM